MTDVELFAKVVGYISPEKLAGLRLGFEIFEGYKKEYDNLETSAPRRNEPPSFSQDVEEAAVNAERFDAAPSPQLKTELPKKAPFPSPSARADYRDKIVREIWSATLRSELVDRIVAIKESGVPACEITEAIGYAKQEELTSGKPLWKTLGSWCKQKYIDAGYEWVRCSMSLEPKPEPIKPTVFVNYRNKQGHSVAFLTRLLTAEQAECLSDSLDDGETTYSPQEINERVAQYAKSETVKKTIQGRPCYRRQFNDDARRKTERETKNALAFEL